MQMMKTERNIGIDFLRLFAMLSVVTLHTISYGGIFAAAVGASKGISWLVYLVAYPAVDCFAIISGYVGYREKDEEIRFSKFFVLWFQAFIYSFGLTMLAMVLKADSINTKQIIKSVLVVTTNQYWYFTKYTGLFFLMPWLDKFVRTCKQIELTCLMVVFFFVFSVYGTVALRIGGDIFDFNQGFTLIWLVLLYLTGAWTKKYDILSRISSKCAILISVLCIVIEWICMMYFQGIIGGGTIVSYPSPTVVIRAVMYVSLFSKMKIQGKCAQIVEYFSPAAFGVFLISTQQYSRLILGSNDYSWIAGLSLILIPFVILLCAFREFVICLLIDKVRGYVFHIIKIEKHISRVEIRIKRKIAVICNMMK